MKTKILITGGSGFIGTNLIELLIKRGIEFVNVDVKAPLNHEHSKYWIKQNFLDKQDFRFVVGNFNPTCIIDLAARTDCNEKVTVEEGYAVNIDGVKNIISLSNETTSIKRIIFTSTQYVHGPGIVPTIDEQYAPHTVYGQSKVQMEKLIRQSTIPCVWTIIRPTNVWGPWHVRYRDQFLKILEKGYYLHPSGQSAVKSYAYVGTVVDQILSIVNAPEQDIDRKTFYVGDPPLEVLSWVNAFSMAVLGKPVRRLPRPLFYMMALAGDLVSHFTRKPFPITTSRYENMIEDYLTPMQKTFDVLGSPKYDLEEGVQATLNWAKHAAINDGDDGSV